MLNKVPEVTSTSGSSRSSAPRSARASPTTSTRRSGFGLTNTTLVVLGRAGRRAGRAVPGAQVHPGRLLAGGRADQRRRHLADRQPHRRAQRAAVDQLDRLLGAARRSCSASGTPGSARCRSTRSSRRRARAFYWLTVLVTFALGTAVGDWTLELTGWTPGTSVLLPAGLIAAVVRRVAARRRPGADLLDRLHPHPAARGQHR